jgi:phosphatidylglycerophosphatase A
VNAHRSPGERIALAIATLFGAGRSPIAPGTAGSLAAIPLVLLAGWLLPPWGFALATAVLIIVAVGTAGVGARALGGHDPGAVVIDEAAGLFVTLLWIPLVPFTVTAGFLLFRVMDVLKPPPARRAESLPGGWGIVIDDCIAGAYANLSLRILILIWPGDVT